MGKIVVPGEEVAQAPVRMAYTYTDGKKTFATVLSMLSDSNKLIPLEGPYEPLCDDYVIGYVTDVKFAGYEVDICAPVRAFLSSKEMRQQFRLGDIMMVRIAKVDEVGSVDLSDAKLLKGGMLIKVSAVKVPRVIGKKNSMVNMVANATGCQILVGRNGYVFITNEGDCQLAIKTIELIGMQAHTSGLTDRIAQYLSEIVGREIKPQPQDELPPAHIEAQESQYQGEEMRQEGGEGYGYERRPHRHEGSYDSRMGERRPGRYSNSRYGSRPPRRGPRSNSRY